MVFEAVLEEVKGTLLLRLPAPASRLLPSRGMGMAQGSLKGQPYVLPAEPDGRGGHFFSLEPHEAEAFGLKPGEPAAFTLAPAASWPEPALLPDLGQALHQEGFLDVWAGLTVKARWEWTRWIRGTGNPATRAKRIAVAMDKMRKGDRRPCCFNAASCTLPQVSKSGVLLD